MSAPHASASFRPSDDEGGPDDDDIDDSSVHAIDAALMQRAARGDVDAFALVYDRHAGNVLALLLRVLRHAGDAQDLLHDVFLEAWQSARSFDATRAPVRVWLLVRARARALDRLRRQSRERAGCALLAQLPTSATSSTLAPELMLALQQALTTLEPKLREVLALTYFEGLSAAEVSERVQTPEGTVRSRLARGIACLQDLLQTGEQA